VPQGTVVRVKFKDRRQFESCWLKDISNGGIFLRTQTPAALFGQLSVVLELPNGDTVELLGEVVRVVAPREAQQGVAAGMGVQFVDLDVEKRAQLEAYLGFTQPIAVPDGLAALAPPPSTPGRRISALEDPAAATIEPTPLPGMPPASAGPPPPVVSVEDMLQGVRRLLWLSGDAAMLADADFYDVIGVSASASGKQIADACTVLRALLDPMAPPPGVRGGSSSRFASLRGLIDEIEVTLLDPARRSRYDSTQRPRR
jgi:uncharacterized protein (TIGR02266 family)